MPRNNAFIAAYAALFVIWLAPYFVNIPVYANLIGLVAIILYLGCHRSLRLRDVNEVPFGERDTITKEDAMKFPVVGSCVLFGLFVVIKFVPKHWVDLIISLYFSAIGAYTIATLIEPATAPLRPWLHGSSAPPELGRVFHVPWLGPVSLIFTPLELSCFAVALAFAAAYFKTKYWLLNNLIGIAFAVQGMEAVSLGSFKVGAILLSGLFLYDIFWVFGTDRLLEGDSVMVTVAKGLDAPIKLLFPRLAAAATVSAAAAAPAASVPAAAAAPAAAAVAKAAVTNFAGEQLEFSMLGLGDIVIPGFFLALLLRFDAERGSAVATHGAHGVFAKPYFSSGMAAYVAGLATTVYVMEVYKAAQPALLYLVPACLGATLVCGAARGELAALFSFDEEEDGRVAALAEAEPEAHVTLAANEKASITAAEGVWEEAVSASIGKPNVPTAAADPKEKTVVAPEIKKTK